MFANRFENKVMIVTGATSGIGKETAIRAAKEGAKVVCVGRNVERGQQVLNTIKENKGEAIFVRADVSTEEGVKSVIDETIKAFDHVDILINNAGVLQTETKSILDITTEEFNRVMSINVNSVFFMTREVGKVLVKQAKGGVIINVGSVAGLTGQKNLAAYVASKHAVTGLTRAAAYDLCQHNVRVIGIAPAGVATPMVANSGCNFAKIAEERGCSQQEVMLDLFGKKLGSMQGGMSDPKEQASTILYFASDEAKHITGSMIASDGGFTAF